MLKRYAPESIAKDLSVRIDDSKEFLGAGRKPMVQVISWIIGDTEAELSHVLNDTYLLLQKTSSKDIVFPSGGVDIYETEKGIPNPQGIILAGLREFKEELYSILSIDADQIIDTLPPLSLDTAVDKERVQFRLLARISPLRVHDIEKKFQETLKYIDLNQQEHNNCFARSYDKIMQEVQHGNRNLKESTLASLKYHHTVKKERYGS